MALGWHEQIAFILPTKNQIKSANSAHPQQNLGDLGQATTGTLDLSWLISSSALRR